MLSCRAFISYLGTIPQLRESPPDPINGECRGSTFRQGEFDEKYSLITLKTLKKLATLGAGAFGQVDLVSYEEEVYALKIIKKIDVLRHEQIEHIYNEKNVMLKCRNTPFIIE